MRASSTLRAVLVLIGFTAILAQIVLMRELMVVFYGNEISLGIILANWLLWTAFGAGVLGRMAARTRNPRRFLAATQGFVGLAFPFTILLVRASKIVSRPMPGEILGPVPMFLASFLVLSIFCSVSGMLFAAASAAVADDQATSTVEATGYVYLLEAVGSGAGGLIASLVLIRYLSPFEIALLVSLLNFLAASLVVQAARRRRAAIGLLLAAFIALPFLGGWLEKTTQSWLWRGFQIVETRNSIYGNLVVVKTEGSQSLFQNGLVMYTVPDPAAAEEAVHFALLQHPAPKSLLLIGGGVNGSLAQALQHTTLERADYVELDPAIFELARDRFPASWAAIRSDSRVRSHATDGRFFLKTTRETYDAVILNLPDPETAQLNRFYTLEFFREAAAHLTPTGIFSLQIHGAEDYVSPELGDFLRCIRKTLGEVFPEVAFIPGGTFHFFAAKQSGVLAAGPEDLQARLRSRHLETSYVREYYIPYRMMPDRMLDADVQTRPLAETPVNRDFAPIAYYFDVAMWSGRFNPNYRSVFHSLAGVPFGWAVGGMGIFLLALTGILIARNGKERLSRSAAGICVAATGFTLMALELMVLLGFQAVFGYVYSQLALLIAAFMVGIAAGSGWALRAFPGALQSPDGRRQLAMLAWLQSLAAISPLLLYALLAGSAQLQSTLGIFVASHAVFPLLALLFGMLGGYQFPVASRVFFASPGQGSRGAGTLYALDLAGACLGAVGLSVYLIPVFGFFKTALVIAVVNLSPVALACLSIFQKRPRPA